MFSLRNAAHCKAVGVRVNEAKTGYVFLMSGSRVGELRMRSIGDIPDAPVRRWMFE